MVGCQLNVAAATTSESGTESATTSATAAPAFGVPSVGASESLTIGAGQAVARDILDIEQPDDCAGHARARSFAIANVSTNAAASVITVSGQPFTMG